MDEQKVSVGRIVHYKLNAADVEATNKRREDTQTNLEKMREERPGFQAHVGNEVSEGDTVAMIVVGVHDGDLINGQVLLDGNDNLWITSAPKGEGSGDWGWPPRV